MRGKQRDKKESNNLKQETNINGKDLTLCLIERLRKLSNHWL